MGGAKREGAAQKESGDCLGFEILHSSPGPVNDLSIKRLLAKQVHHLDGLPSGLESKTRSHRRDPATGVQSAAMVGIDKVNSSVFVLDNDLARSHFRSRVVGLDLHCVGITNFADHCRLHGIRDGRKASSG